MAGILEDRYLQVHPGATAGLEVCRFLQDRPGQWFTQAELKAALGCGDRVLRQRVPDVLNSGDVPLLLIDKSGRAWRYCYPGASR